MPSHFAGLSQSRLDPERWATTKNFEKSRISEKHSLYKQRQEQLGSFLLNFDLKTQYQKS